MSYGSTDVLHGIDLDIHRGEIFALLGPNGAGKTTTVEILEGFRQRSGGEVGVLGPTRRRRRRLARPARPGAAVLARPPPLAGAPSC